MAAEYSAVLAQEVSPNQPIVFTDSPCPCNEGLIFKKSGGIFLLASNAPQGNGCSCGCGCRPIYMTDYQVGFHGNVQIPEDGEVGEIILAIAVDGVTDPASVMRYNPTDTEVAGNVGTEIIVSVPSICGCENVAVLNIGTEAVEVLNASLTFDYAGIRRVR